MKEVYKKHNYRVSFFTLTVILGLLAIGLITNINKAYSSTYKKYKIITVDKGDTIWQIAKENNYNNQDIRKVVYIITRLNKMENAKIHPGDTIKVPIE
ncbi:cell division suppressor protein YneA [Caldisalinibacter kiritimatiensis]|uniref:LysM domain-containing protein n=1 Tax=Caldisalinibacter kiritimatiensis TaxID=1304284 RepID=R1AX07_9FIRM|nr:LysM peptidoglycan-binding domain-containing protein [Caldisalinibacter kiritimatiensis]EOD01738.1 hypothetical protein L21TH_0177 [Caldisalinibacter kiritimatiensis]